MIIRIEVIKDNDVVQERIDFQCGKLTSYTVMLALKSLILEFFKKVV